MASEPRRPRASSRTAAAFYRACAGVCLFGGMAAGAQSSWVAPGGGNWSDAGSWLPTIPNAPGDEALFGNSVTNAAVVAVDGSFTVGRLTLDSAHPYTLQGTTPSALLLSALGGEAAITVRRADGSNAHTLDVPLILSSDTLFTLDEGTRLTVSGEVGGAGSLRKTGAGRLVLSAGNTYSGSTVVDAGFMRLTGRGTLGAADSTEGTATFVNVGGTLELEGASIVAEKIVLNGGKLLPVGSASSVVRGPVELRGRSTVGNSGGGGRVHFEGVISGSAPLDVLSGYIELRGANSYSGTTRIEGATVVSYHATGLGSPGEGTFVGGGGTLQIMAVGNEPISLGGGALYVNGTHGVSVTSVTEGTLLGGTFAGGIQGPGALKIGGGTVDLGVANTYQGTTEILAGTANVNHSQALGTATAGTIVSGGTLNINVPIQEQLMLTGGTTNLNAASSFSAAFVATGGTINVNHLGAFVEPTPTLRVVGAAYNVNVPLAVSSLRLDAGAVGGRDVLTSLESVVPLRSGMIHFTGSGGLSGVGAFDKWGIKTAVLGELGPTTDPTLVVNEGTLEIRSGVPRDITAVATVGASRHAVLDVNRAVSMPIVLNDATGFAFSGGLTSSSGDSSRLTGNINLGSRGAIVSGNLELAGVISGGDLTQAQGGTLRLSNAGNTYAGRTAVGVEGAEAAGGPTVMVLQAEGRLHATSEIVIHRGGELILDNSRGTGSVNDRVADEIPVELTGGTLALVRAVTEESHETVRLRARRGASRVHMMLGPEPGEPKQSVLTLADFARDRGATVSFRGVSNGTHSSPKRILFNTAPSLTGNILGGWATLDEEFPTYDPVTGVAYLPTASLRGEAAGASPADNVFLDQAPPQPLTADTSLNSLRLHTWGNNVLDLGGHELNIVSGGLLRMRGEQMYEINGGRLTAGGSTPDSELFLHVHPRNGTSVRSETRIGADIVDNAGGAVHVVKTEEGLLLLSGNNTYTGKTFANDGVLAVEQRRAIPNGNAIEVNGGEYRIAFDDETPIDLGTVALRHYGQITATNRFGNGPTDVTIDADSYHLEAGSIYAKLGGAGPITKSTLGTVYLRGDNGAYSGNITVNEGILVAGGSSFGGGGAETALGTGLTTVNASARLVLNHAGPIGGNVVLDGGELAGGSDNQTFSGRLVVKGDATVLTFNGLQKAAPQALTTTLTGDFTMESGSTLRLVGGDGGGLTVNGRQQHGDAARVVVEGGLLSMNSDAGAPGQHRLSVDVRRHGSVHFGSSQHIADLKLEQGATGIADGVEPVTLHLKRLSMSDDSRLDLRDNALRLDGAGDAHTLIREVAQQIASARNGGSARWQGPGITSLTAAAQPLTGLASAVVGNEVVVLHTYEGDANLDGRINADDYFKIDSGFLEQPQDPLYAQGDFNYDDKIDADDYFLIDSAFLGQAAAAHGGALGVVSVPEPVSSVAVLAFGALCLCRRQTRGHAEVRIAPRCKPSC